MCQEAKVTAADQDASSERPMVAPPHEWTARRVVEPEEFYRLAISSRRLLRCDDMAVGLRGLWDPADAIWYVIEEEHLHQGSSDERRRPLERHAV